MHCLPRASHKPSDASKSGFPSLCAWAGALAQPLLTPFPQVDLEASTSLLFHGTEEAERLKIWLSDLPHSRSIHLYLACCPLLLPTHLAIKCLGLSHTHRQRDTPGGSAATKATPQPTTSHRFPPQSQLTLIPRPFLFQLSSSWPQRKSSDH